MNTQVIITLKLNIPYSEIADIDEKSLKEFIKFELGVSPEMPQNNQFSRYELADFNPDLKELWKNTKRLI